MKGTAGLTFDLLVNGSAAATPGSINPSFLPAAELAFLSKRQCYRPLPQVQ